MGNNIFLYEDMDDVKNKSLEQFRRIYTHIVDKKSKEIFIKRVLLSLTMEAKYMRELILLTDVGRNFDEFLNEQKKIYIYGAGVRGKRIIEIYPEKNWIAYIDQKKEGVYKNLPILKYEELNLDDDAIILVSNLEKYNLIYKELMGKGVKKEQIVLLSEIEEKIQKQQYFEDRCCEFFKDTDGAFVDAGFFDGRDSIKFLELYNKETQIYAFEPDKNNYSNCREIKKKFPNIKLYDQGLSDKEECLNFESNRGEKARFVASGDSKVKVNSLDNFLLSEKIGYIKMDIEGFEYKALKGAEKIIKRDTPNMMISVYHKMDDIINIPNLILQINPNYQFALGHYAVGSIVDTVLYAFQKLQISTN